MGDIELSVGKYEHRCKLAGGVEDLFGAENTWAGCAMPAPLNQKALGRGRSRLGPPPPPPREFIAFTLQRRRLGNILSDF